MNKYDLEDFKKIWKETSKEGILNQFYYEHIDLEQLQSNWNSLREYVIQLQKLKGINQQGFSWGVAQEVLDKMSELEGKDNGNKSKDV